MKISRFTILLTLAILMTIGAAVTPLIDVTDQPRRQQGRTLTVSFRWNGASAKVIEQNVTSRIEGLVSAVKGVKSTESESNFGSGHVTVELKPQTNVSATKFEISSLIRQIYRQLPEGVSYPDLSGGEVPTEGNKKECAVHLLTYQVNSVMGGDRLNEYMEQALCSDLRRIEGVRGANVTGATDKYIEISYSSTQLAIYGLTATDLENGIRNFVGRNDIVGDITHTTSDGTTHRMALYLTTDKFAKPLEQMPIATIDGKTVYLNDLATFEYKDKLPDSYFRVNGLATVYVNVSADASEEKIIMSRKVRAEIERLTPKLRKGVYLTLIYDAAEEAESELHKLVWRSLTALFILLGFVWLTRRSLKYLTVIAIALAANILIAAIAYWALDIRLHIYSLAGITVSLSLIIDATVVMVEHYSYYRNRRAFMAILAALLTTIGSLAVVFWLPEQLQNDLRDFAWIIIVNLSVALLVAYFFSPALIDTLGYSSAHQGHMPHRWLALWWKRIYTRYVTFTQHRKWIYITLVTLIFGVPFHALPSRWGGDRVYGSDGKQKTKVEPWYATAYNNTFGSDLFQTRMKEPLSKVFGGTMRLFAKSLDNNNSHIGEQQELKLHITGKMPLGGSTHELNEKVIMLEAFLSKFKEIKRFEARVGNNGASIDVDFKDEYKETSFPYDLEHKVIGRMISIGGADWSTSGVSRRGFSNSLNLQYRSNHIDLTGYNYDRLYRLAEDICDYMRKNSRVVDLIIETPGHEHQEDEFYMRYNKERMALYDFDLLAAHQAVREMVSGRPVERYRDRYTTADMYMKPVERDSLDLWNLNNAYLHTTGGDVRLANFMNIERREAKNSINKRNQEYRLRVSFNMLGSYTYSHKYIEQTMNHFNATMPVGFRCQSPTWGYYNEGSTRYWLLLVVIVIVFFICAILFESLRLPLAILSLVPISFIGTFVTYWLSGVEFGTGGYASLVMLCGLTVNAGIYVVAEYIGETRDKGELTAAQKVRYYVRAYNHKTAAVFLTVLSTVLGLIPFFIDGKDEAFWFSFATGTAGGLLFSIVALVFFMPIALKLGSDDNKTCPT